MLLKGKHKKLFVPLLAGGIVFLSISGAIKSIAVAEDLPAESGYKGTVYIGENLQEDAFDGTALASKAAVTVDAAITAAKTACPSYTVQETGLGEENGYLVYDIDMLSPDNVAFEVKVDAGNASIVRISKEEEVNDEKDEEEDKASEEINTDSDQNENESDFKGTIYIGEISDDDSDIPVEFAFKATVTLEEAIKISKAALPEYIPMEIGFEDENGYLVYNMIMADIAGQAFEVKVDAGNAANTKIEKYVDEEQEDIQGDKTAAGADDDENDGQKEDAEEDDD